MNGENDIIATAPADSPEELDAETLDHVTGGTAYGGTNTCEPVQQRYRLRGAFIKSYSFGGSAD